MLGFSLILVGHPLPRVDVDLLYGGEGSLASRWALKLDLDFTYEGDDGDIRPWPQAGLFFYW